MNQADICQACSSFCLPLTSQVHCYLSMKHYFNIYTWQPQMNHCFECKRNYSLFLSKERLSKAGFTLISGKTKIQKIKKIHLKELDLECGAAKSCGAGHSESVNLTA